MANRTMRVLGALTALGLGLATVEAQAAAVLIGTYSGNECGGQGGFSNCYAFGNAFPNGTTAQGPGNGDGSPAIFKHGISRTGAVETEISSLFSSAIDGSEFDVDLEPGNILSFDYTPGAGDPAIHYFAIFQAGTTNLFYDASPITSGDISLDLYYPNNPGYSHITFFDTGTPAVPEPATWAMMLLGFGFIGGMMRSAKRRRKLTVSYA